MKLTLNNELERGKIIPVIYSPDTFKSNLQGNLDSFIFSQTELIPVYRKWYQHDSHSIELFYEENISRIAPNWNLVNYLFLSGPVLITLWYGDFAFDKFTLIKGKSHPNFADSNTIRGGFNCDNSICNLIHSSDGVSESIKELGILKIIEDTNFKSSRKFERAPFFEGFNQNILLMQHSGIITFYKILLRISKTIHYVPFDQININTSDSRIIYSQLKIEIYRISKKCRIPIELVNLYFNGDFDFINLLKDIIPIFEWEEFILKCGLATVNKWC